MSKILDISVPARHRLRLLVVDAIECKPNDNVYDQYDNQMDWKVVDRGLSGSTAIMRFGTRSQWPRPASFIPLSELSNCLEKPLRCQLRRVSNYLDSLVHFQGHASSCSNEGLHHKVVNNWVVFKVTLEELLLHATVELLRNSSRVGFQDRHSKGEGKRRREMPELFGEGLRLGMIASHIPSTLAHLVTGIILV